MQARFIPIVLCVLLGGTAWAQEPAAAPAADVVELRHQVDNLKAQLAAAQRVLTTHARALDGLQDPVKVLNTRIAAVKTRCRALKGRLVTTIVVTPGSEPVETSTCTVRH